MEIISNLSFRKDKYKITLLLQLATSPMQEIESPIKGIWLDKPASSFTNIFDALIII